MILLDTVVVSEFRKARPSSAAVAWLRQFREEDLFLSVVTVGEIERGIALASDDIFRGRLERWLDETLLRFGSRMLDVTPAIARRWGRWSADHGHSGADVMIAATADIHGLAVATRNARHFERFGVPVVNPFA